MLGTVEKNGMKWSSEEVRLSGGVCVGLLTAVCSSLASTSLLCRRAWMTLSFLFVSRRVWRSRR